jgi:hypothetical protein
MKILEEIIENLSDSNFQITSALIKTKILLHKIGRKDLSEWVNNEINGYVGKENLPEYRIIPSIVLANFESFSHRATSHPIPLHHLDQNTREALQNICIRQSLASIEKLLLSETKNFQNPIPMCRVPDDWLLKNKRPLLHGREVLQAVLATWQSRAKELPC